MHPALVATECRVSNEDDLREPDELAAVRKLRVAARGPRAGRGRRLLRERIEGTPSNAELLAGLD